LVPTSFHVVGDDGGDDRVEGDKSVSFCRPTPAKASTNFAVQLGGESIITSVSSGECWQREGG
jgi:hypothetical protein